MHKQVKFLLWKFLSKHTLKSRWISLIKLIWCYTTNCLLNFTYIQFKEFLFLGFLFTFIWWEIFNKLATLQAGLLGIMIMCICYCWFVRQLVVSCFERFSWGLTFFFNRWKLTFTHVLEIRIFTSIINKITLIIHKIECSTLIFIVLERYNFILKFDYFLSLFTEFFC